MEHFLKGDYYDDKYVAISALKEFGRPWHSVWALDIPVTRIYDHPNRDKK